MLTEKLKYDLESIITEIEPITGAAIIAVSIARMAIRIKLMRIESGTDKCYKNYKGHLRKNCILKVKISAQKRQLNHIAKSMNKCNKSVNPHKCKEILNKKITIIRNKISDLEQKMRK